MKKVILCFSVLAMLIVLLASCGHEHAFKSVWGRDSSNHWHSCEGCSEVSDQAAHTFQVKSVVSSSCDAASTVIEACEVCGYERTVDGEPQGHDFNEVVVAPTCTQTGKTKVTCNREGCNYYAEKDAKPTLGHDTKDASLAPTCTEEGYIGIACTRCTYLEKLTIKEATGHVLNEEKIPPTCSEQGRTEVTCENCDYFQETNIVSKIPHSCYMGEDAQEGIHYEVTREPGCVDAGEITYYCRVCNELSDASSDKVAIDPIGHNMVVDIEPWCGNGGATEYRCDRVSNGVSCLEVSIEPATQEYRHTYGEVLAKETCVKNAEYNCSKCGVPFTAYEGDSVGQATGKHTYDIKVEDVPSNCSLQGYTVYECSQSCGNTENRDFQPKGAHVLDAPTEHGTVTCTICHKSYVDITAEKIVGSDKICLGCGNDPCTCEGTTADWEGYTDPKEPMALIAYEEFAITEVQWADGAHPLAMGKGVIELISSSYTNYTITLYATADGEAVNTITVSGAELLVDLYEYETIGKIVIVADGNSFVSFYSIIG